MRLRGCVSMCVRFRMVITWLIRVVWVAVPTNVRIRRSFTKTYALWHVKVMQPLKQPTTWLWSKDSFSPMDGCMHCSHASSASMMCELYICTSSQISPSFGILHIGMRSRRLAGGPSSRAISDMHTQHALTRERIVFADLTKYAQFRQSPDSVAHSHRHRQNMCIPPQPYRRPYYSRITMLALCAIQIVMCASRCVHYYCTGWSSLSVCVSLLVACRWVMPNRAPCHFTNAMMLMWCTNCDAVPLKRSVGPLNAIMPTTNASVIIIARHPALPFILVCVTFLITLLKIVWWILL